MSGPDLEARILNRLQEHPQTVAQLSAFLKAKRETHILRELYKLRQSGQVIDSKGVCTLVRPL